MLDKYSGTPVDYKLDSTMFCTVTRDMDNSVVGGKGDLCSQDYGSPLVCALDFGHPDQWTLIGLATWRYEMKPFREILFRRSANETCKVDIAHACSQNMRHLK